MIPKAITKILAPRHRKESRGMIAVGATALGLAGVYTFALRPRLLRWGATDEEVERPFPGADIIPDATRGATMAITIDAPPAKVWPWLAQMGTDRGGWYSWDKLDNWGRKSVEQVHPEWQKIGVGDHFNAIPDGSEWWEVAALEPEHFLCLRMSVDLRGRPFDPQGERPRFYTDSTWGFLLEPLPGDRTRLVVSGYWALQPRWLQTPFSILALEPSHWIMQMRQFANLKRLAERDVTGTSSEAASEAGDIAIPPSHRMARRRPAVADAAGSHPMTEANGVAMAEAGGTP